VGYNVKSEVMLSPATGALILERLPRVKSRTGLSRSEIYRRCATNPPTFPRPVKLGIHASAWAEHEVSQWIADRIAARDAKAAA
jgi:prophage regulatory protein